MGGVKSRAYGSYRIHHNNEVDTDKDLWADGNADTLNMAKPDVKICKSKDEIIRHLGYLIEKTANDAIRKSNNFKVAVSGGSLPDYLCQILPTIKSDWSKWLIFFCDERLVPFDDSESTYGVYRQKLFGLIPIEENNVIKVDVSLSAQTAANDYSSKIAHYFPDMELPKFDLLLLGMGPDGHTCSLFPDHPLLKEQALWVAPITDSPKPPPSRVTLTLPVVNNSSTACFLCTGAAKAEVVKQILENPECRLPAALVKPIAGELHWILDEDAGSLLTLSKV
ncbi:hypothetical protein CHUAL_006079 [Chamberlinius hualienensis]